MYIDSALSHDNPSYPLATELVGKGNTLALGDGKMIAVQQLADATYRVYFGLVVPEDFYPRSHCADSDANARTEAMRSRLLSSNEFFANYAPHLKGFIEKAEGPFRPLATLFHGARDSQLGAKYCCWCDIDWGCCACFYPFCWRGRQLQYV